MSKTKSASKAKRRALRRLQTGTHAAARKHQRRELHLTMRAIAMANELQHGDEQCTCQPAA